MPIWPSDTVIQGCQWKTHSSSLLYEMTASSNALCLSYTLGPAADSPTFQIHPSLEVSQGPKKNPSLSYEPPKYTYFMDMYRFYDI